jgi:hypothetical protein
MKTFQALKSYYEVPIDVLEDDVELCRWARAAVDVHRRKDHRKTRGGRTRRVPKALVNVVQSVIAEVDTMRKPRCALALPATIAFLVCAHAASANSIWISSVAIQCATAPDDTVRVDVMLENNLEPIDGGTLYVSPWDYLYPFVGAERGDLIAGWAQFNAYPQAFGGGVTIEISNDTPIPPGTSDGWCV